MHHQLDTLAYGNRLRWLPPDRKLAFAIALFGLGYALPPPGQLAIALWLGVWVVGYGGIPGGVYLQLLAVPTGFLLASLPALLVEVAATAGMSELDAVWGQAIGPVYLYLTEPGIERAASLVARAIALTSCLYFLILTAPMADLLRALRQWHCPTPIVELLALMYRFIAVLAETANELVTAQRSRGGYRTWGGRLRSASAIAGQLLWRTLENYRQISLGLQSRGFTGSLQVWHARRDRQVSPEGNRPIARYAVEAAIGCALLAVYATWHHAHRL